jgi:hypothetical protein
MIVAVCIVFLIGIIFLLFKEKQKEKRIYYNILARSPYPIEIFIREYDINFTQEQIVFIKKVRYCIASLAKVPEDNIYPLDSFFDTINYLPFWNWFDDGVFINLLHSETGILFQSELWIKIKKPDMSKNDIKVKDFIFNLLQNTQYKWVNTSEIDTHLKKI